MSVIKVCVAALGYATATPNSDWIVGEKAPFHALAIGRTARLEADSITRREGRNCRAANSSSRTHVNPTTKPSSVITNYSRMGLYHRFPNHEYCHPTCTLW